MYAYAGKQLTWQPAGKTSRRREAEGSFYETSAKYFHNKMSFVSFTEV